MNLIVKRIAKKAGVWRPGVNATSLRMGFVMKAAETVGAAATATAAGYARSNIVTAGFARSSQWAREQRLLNLKRRPKWRLSSNRSASSTELQLCVIGVKKGGGRRGNLRVARVGWK